jgi:cob(I)alamin adenosyltransferase
MKLEKYTQISTKNGDKGTSKNYSNQEFRKDDTLFEVVGTIDELSSLLGVAYHYTVHQEEIKSVQRNLQDINSLVATTDKKMYQKLRQITVDDISQLEDIEQNLIGKVTVERVFVLPGSEQNKEGAYLHLARAVARRAERTLVRFVFENHRDDLELSMKYLNRLSDLLFIMASE